MNKKISLLLAGILSASLFIAGCENNKANTQTTKSNESTQPAEEEKAQADESDKKGETNSNTSEDKVSKEITIYSYDVDKEDLIKINVSLDTVDENTLFTALQDNGVISKTAKLNSFKVEEIDGVKTAVIDVDSNFVNSNLGSDAEDYMLRAFARTYIENMGAEQVKLTVDGSNYESGHIVLEDGDFLK